MRPPCTACVVQQPPTSRVQVLALNPSQIQNARDVVVRSGGRVTEEELERLISSPQMGVTGRQLQEYMRGLGRPKSDRLDICKFLRTLEVIQNINMQPEVYDALQILSVALHQRNHSPKDVFRCNVVDPLLLSGIVSPTAVCNPLQPCCPSCAYTTVDCIDRIHTTKWSSLRCRDTIALPHCPTTITNLRRVAMHTLKNSVGLLCASCSTPLVALHSFFSWKMQDGIEDLFLGIPCADRTILFLRLDCIQAAGSLSDVIAPSLPGCSTPQQSSHAPEAYKRVRYTSNLCTALISLDNP